MFIGLLFCIGFAGQWSHAYAQAEAQSTGDRPVVVQRVQYPHSNGYQLGDVFEHVLQIEIRRPYKLVKDSLPSKGRVSGYIELQTVSVSESPRLRSSIYKVALRYQVINYDDALVGTSVPPALVSFSSETDVYPVVIEPWGLTISPFLMKEARNYGSMPLLEPLTEVTTIPLWRQLLISLLLLLGGIVLLLPIIQRTLIRPLVRRRNRPFIKAHRKVRKIMKDQSLASLEHALRCLHQAFNNKLGRTVLSEDVELFLLGYPEFSDSRDAINRFFSISDQHFFGEGELTREEIKSNTSFITSLAGEMQRKEWRERQVVNQALSDEKIKSGRYQAAWVNR